MMEEINDDANGESSFEFVGGKVDENMGKGEPVSSSSAVSGEPLSASSSLPSVANPSFMPSGGGLFSPNVQSSANIPSQSFLPVTPPSVASIPMFDPSKQASSISFPTSFSSPVQMQQPVQSTSPYIPPGQGYMSSLPTPPSNFSSLKVSEAALELPLDDNYVSSSDPTLVSERSDQGVWGWFKGNDFLNRVAEKAKSSVDSVITTLDPGMKEIIYSGGDLNLVVASGSEAKVSAVREAFQQVFGKATVESIPVQSTSIAPQPVGFSAGTKAVEERISNLRQQGLIQEDQVVVAVENFLAELTPDKWFDLGCLQLQDPRNGINLQVYTQAVPVASHYVMQAKERTAADYHLSWSGYAVTIGQVLGPALGVHHSHWHEAMTGTSRREMLTLAAKSLAGMYKAQWKR